MTAQTWYHGTTAENAAGILREGLHRKARYKNGVYAPIWFARRARSAANFGAVILAVSVDDDMHDIAMTEPAAWDMCCYNPVSPSRIRLFATWHLPHHSQRACGMGVEIE